MPYPTRPYPTRPYPTRESDPPSTRLDADEWSADVSDLLFARSAVIGLGARVLIAEGRIPVPAVLEPAPGYLPIPATTLARGVPVVHANARPANAGVSVRELQPSRFELAFNIIIPDDLARELAEHPESAWAVKEDMARALALSADRAFLNGGGPDKFAGIGTLAGVADPAAAGAPAVVRAMLHRLRATAAVFACPGWILSSATLDLLATARQGTRTWDSTGALELDGAGGGRLLGSPFITSQAAGAWIYLSADWSEAWIGAQQRLVTVDVSRDANIDGRTVIRAVSHHELVIRHPDLFVAGVVDAAPAPAPAKPKPPPKR